VKLSVRCPQAVVISAWQGKDWQGGARTGKDRCGRVWQARYELDGWGSFRSGMARLHLFLRVTELCQDEGLRRCRGFERDDNALIDHRLPYFIW